MATAQAAARKEAMKKSFKILLALVLVLAAGIGIISMINSSRKDSSKISIVTTNFPAYDFARAVAGDKADVKMLLKPGAETHDFEPSPNDIIDIQKSDLFVYTGGESDDWVEGILTDSDAKVKTFAMMDAVETVEEEIVEGMEAEEEEGSEEEAEYDEHVWTSPKNAIKIIEKLKEELSKISPENKDVFASNTEKYTNTLSELDNKFQNIVNNAKRKVLVFGDRFPLRYFVEDYNLEYYAAFPGCAEQSEASSKTIAFLSSKIKSEKIPVVFKIEMSSNGIAETIAKETGAKVLVFNSAHNISADDFNRGLTYAEIMEGNLEVLEEALN